jgi:histidinol-phosphate aminotransferase
VDAGEPEDHIRSERAQALRHDMAADPGCGPRLGHGRTIEFRRVTDWSSLTVPPPPELDPFDIGGVGEIKRRYGLDEVVKLHWNENLFGPLPGVVEAAHEELHNMSMYPEEAYEGFRSDVAEAIGTTRDRIIPGHGTQALIGTVATTFIRAGDDIVVPDPTYYLYAKACVARGATVHRVPMPALRIDVDALVATALRTEAKILWLCDPNNPTGGILDQAQWTSLLDALPQTCVAVVDEAYADYVAADRRVPRISAVEEGHRVVLLRSFSKFYGLAGLRLGYAVVDAALASYLALVEEPYNVNCAALAAGRACLRAREAADERRHEVSAAREVLAQGLREAGAEPLPSMANFVLARIDVDDLALADRLAERGILIRPGSDLGLPGYVRITVGPVSLMQLVSTVLREACDDLRS